MAQCCDWDECSPDFFFKQGIQLSPSIGLVNISPSDAFAKFGDSSGLRFLQTTTFLSILVVSVLPRVFDNFVNFQNQDRGIIKFVSV